VPTPVGLVMVGSEEGDDYVKIKEEDAVKLKELEYVMLEYPCPGDVPLRTPLKYEQI
jgi:hypothetical protein